MSILLPTRRPLLGSPFNAFDRDAQTYIRAVEAADGQPLEAVTRSAINTFIVGCKQDGIWDAIKASCILAGARTLAGCLVPLKGTAPTNFNFVAGDYGRKTGLKGDRTSKYLLSGFSVDSSYLNNMHLYAKASLIDTAVTNQHLLGTVSPTEVWYNPLTGPTHFAYRANDGTGGVDVGTTNPGGYGWSRNSSTFKTTIAAGTTTIRNDASSGIATGQVAIFARNNASSVGGHRLNFYSIGTSLDLALLDARVTTLINAFGTLP